EFSKGVTDIYREQHFLDTQANCLIVIVGPVTRRRLVTIPSALGAEIRDDRQRQAQSKSSSDSHTILHRSASAREADTFPVVRVGYPRPLYSCGPVHPTFSPCASSPGTPQKNFRYAIIQIIRKLR